MAGTAPKGSIALSVDQRDIQAVGRMFKAQSDGRKLRAELVANIAAITEPVVSEIRSTLQAVPHDGPSPSDPAMGPFLASRVKTSMRFAGYRTGVSVKMRKTPQLRGFAFASRRLNRRTWRHKVFGKDAVWVEQTSPIPGFFDDPFQNKKAEYRAAVMEAVAAMRSRLIRRGAA